MKGITTTGDLLSTAVQDHTSETPIATGLATSGATKHIKTTDVSPTPAPQPTGALPTKTSPPVSSVEEYTSYSTYVSTDVNTLTAHARTRSPTQTSSTFETNTDDSKTSTRPTSSEFYDMSSTSSVGLIVDMNIGVIAITSGTALLIILLIGGGCCVFEEMRAPEGEFQRA